MPCLMLIMVTHGMSQKSLCRMSTDTYVQREQCERHYDDRTNDGNNICDTFDLKE